MTYDYDKLYGETRDALGDPTAIIVDFFRNFSKSNARVLDVGCGQGRDALFIARRGHYVVAVDLSANGIHEVKAVATDENLPVEGIVADITNFTPPGVFDFVLTDRTLHMLEEAERISVLSALLDHVARDGWMLIVDEVSNINSFKTVIAAHASAWTIKHQKRGCLFAQKAQLVQQA